MSDALTPVWQRLDSAQPVFFHADLERALNGGREPLLRLGVLREASPALHAQCLECGRGHLVPVVWATNARTAEAEARLPCPECGPVPIAPDRVRRWVVDVPALLARACAAASIRPALAEPVPGHLWYLGTAVWAGRRREAYCARFVHGHPRAAVLAALAPFPRAVLFHPTEHALRLWGAATPNPTVALESVVGFGPDGLTFDAAAVAARLGDADPAAPAPKPPRKRATRAAKIEALLKELREHLRAARAHARGTLDLRGAPELLPRPTQKHLAERCGLTEADVSRCLKDPEAELLRLVWSAAADLDRVLGWTEPLDDTE